MLKDKKHILEKISTRDYRIYGIFNFDKKELIYINFDLEQVELEFLLSCYDDTIYDIVEFNIRLF